MVGKTFSNWKVLNEYLKKEIDKALEEDISKAIKYEIQTGIREVVYDSGDPVSYERRSYVNEGLGDISTMNHNVSNGKLTVTPDAKRNTGFSKYPGKGYNRFKPLSFNIVAGYGDRESWYNKPRDFITKSVDNIKDSKSHIFCMKESLKERLGKNSIG